MQIGKWKTWACFGWFKGNPPAGFVFRLGDIVEDYPSGWGSITILGIQIGKFLAEFGISTL